MKAFNKKKKPKHTRIKKYWIDGIFILESFNCKKKTDRFVGSVDADGNVTTCIKNVEKYQCIDMLTINYGKTS